jgi:hypothetical protein
VERDESWEARKRRYLEALGEKVGVEFHLEGRRGSRWARSARGVIALLASREHPGPLWWFGLQPDEFDRQRALGVIFLCLTEDGLVDFGLPASRLKDLLPSVSREARTGEHKLHIVRQGPSFVLRPALDLTPFRSNVSWLQSGEAPPSSGDKKDPRHPPDAALGSGVPRSDAAFFARVREGRLEPLDPMGLREGELVLVRAAIAKAVPGNAALRRILARGGPEGLPVDFAERHDQYARETHR